MKYERLTDSETAEMLKNTECVSWDSDLAEAQRYIRLSELEDKIENGTMIELPCKIGDTVYFIFDYINGIAEYEVDGFEIDCYGRLRIVLGVSFHPVIDSFKGEWLFFTRDEAEDSLLEMKKKFLT